MNPEAENSDSSLAAKPIPPADADIECLTCGYDLRGLADQRCPECGAPFDLAELRRLSTRDPRPVLPWDDRDRIGWVRAWVTTCMMTWLSPLLFVRSFPACHALESAMSFSVACLLVAALPIVGIAAWPGGAPLDVIVAFLPGAFLSVTGCEMGLGLLFSLLLEPTGVRRDGKYHFWRGLMHFSRAWVPLSSVGWAVGLAIYEWFHTKDEWVTAVGSSWSSAIVPIWWAVLGSMVVARAKRRGPGLVVAILLLPVVALIGGIPGFVIGVALASAFAG